MENNGDEDDYDDNDTLQRLRLTFTPNGKREFAPRDQVFPPIFRLPFIASTQK